MSAIVETPADDKIALASTAGRIVKASLADFESRSTHYPEPARESAAYLFQFMHERCNGSPALVAEILRKLNPQDYPDKEQYVYQVTTGRYFRQGAGRLAVENLVELAQRLRQWDLLEQSRGRIAFNEQLRNWKLVRDYVDRKRDRGAVCKFGAIQGDTGEGKSACCAHYQLLNNHGQTVMLEAPSIPSLPRFLMKLGAAYNITRGLSTNERLIEIEKNVNDTRCIIIQNIQKLYNRKAGPNQPIFNYLQELQDDTSCSIIVTWTPTFRDELTNGRDSKYFAQFVSRLGGIDDVLVLKRPNKADLLSILEQFEITDTKDALRIIAPWAFEAGAYRLIYERLRKAKLLAGKHRLTTAHIDLVATTPVEKATEEGEA